jgi:hypothetical protein
VSLIATTRVYQCRLPVASPVVVTPGEPTKYGLEQRDRIFTVGRIAFLIGATAFVAFWGWALFFANKTALNKIEDRAWASRAETICVPVKAALRSLELEATSDLTERADLVVESTDLLTEMLNHIEAVAPADEKGRALIPQWIGDYRTLLQDRYRYADVLRSGENRAFSETPVQGVPITERIETFAGDNEMPSCAPPRSGVL